MHSVILISSHSFPQQAETALSGGEKLQIGVQELLLSYSVLFISDTMPNKSLVGTYRPYNP